MLKNILWLLVYCSSVAVLVVVEKHFGMPVEYAGNIALGWLSATEIVSNG